MLEDGSGAHPTNAAAPGAHPISAVRPAVHPINTKRTALMYTPLPRRLREVYFGRPAQAMRSSGLYVSVLFRWKYT